MNTLPSTPVGFLCLLASASLPCPAQPVFNVENLPRTIGNYYRAYVDTNEVDVSRFLGAKGGPQRWDFSAPRGPNDQIQRIDIVAPADGGRGKEFPLAAYAERTTHESTGKQSWSYYQISAQQGRLYFGFDDPMSNPANPVKVFDAPTIDLPAAIVFGQRWHREVDFGDRLDIGFTEVNVAIHFVSDAVVDAWGTLVLPEIGEVPALRVNELNSYDVRDRDIGLPLGVQYSRNYYWLVKGVGKAAHIISKTSTSPVPENFSTARTILRVFESNTVEPPPPDSRSVKNLRATVKGNELFLTWDKETSATRYQIQLADDVSAESKWRVLAETSDNFYFIPLSKSVSAGFFCVLFGQ